MSDPAFKEAAVPAARPAGDPVIGILGGMGPEATVDLMRRVIARTPARGDEDHIRMLVDNNPKVPSRIAALLERTGADPGEELVRMARGLQAGGATALAIACNTAHAFAPQIAGAVDIPLLDMIELAADALAALRPQPRKIGVLASSAALKVGLYEKALAARGIQTFAPERQDALMDVIRAVKTGDTGPGQRRMFDQIAGDLVAAGADGLIVACTELSILADALAQPVPVVDALDVLVTKIVAVGLADR